jgi:hypothetical protein
MSHLSPRSPHTWSCTTRSSETLFVNSSSSSFLMAKYIDLVMQTVQTSETFVNLHESTRRYNPEDSHLHTYCRENLKSYLPHIASRINAFQNARLANAMSEPCVLCSGTSKSCWTWQTVGVALLCRVLQLWSHKSCCTRSIHGLVVTDDTGLPKRHVSVCSTARCLYLRFILLFINE